MSEPVTQIPPKPVVRIIASIFLFIAVALFAITILQWEVFNLWQRVLFVSVELSVILLAGQALKTGDPEWLLLGLLFYNN